MTGIDRRRLLGALGVSGAAASVGAVFWSVNNTNNTAPILLSAADDLAGRHCLVGKALDGRNHFCIPVPERAHQARGIPQTQLAVYFGRRPSALIYIVDTAAGRILHTIHAPQGRHFYGHGVAHPQNGYLFVSENDYKNTRGVIGIYATKPPFARIGEFDSGGLGPHQIELLNSELLVVANGGIETHPSDGREILNLATMAPNLSYIAVKDGVLVDQVQPSHHQMSIRHFAITPNNTVVIGIQDHQSPLPESPLNPLVLRHTLGSKLQPLQCEMNGWMRMQSYIASVAVSQDNRWALTTTPRGNLVSLWDLSEQQAVKHATFRDVAGALWLNSTREFIASNGLGQWLRVPTDTNKQEAVIFTDDQLLWDNHMALSQNSRDSAT